MIISRTILTLFICSSLTSSAQDYIKAQKSPIHKSEKQYKDTTHPKKTSTKGKVPKIGTENKQPKQNIVINPGGIEKGNLDIGTNKVKDSIKNLKDSIKKLENDNLELKQNNETLKREKKKLQDDLNSIQRLKNGNNKKKNFSIFPFLITTFFLSFFFIAIVVFILFNRGKFKLNFLLTKKQKYPHHEQKVLVTPGKTTKTPVLVSNTNTSQSVVSKISNGPKSFSNIVLLRQKKSFVKEWYVVGASAIGKSHIIANKPCQDNHYCENIGYGWGIAVSCDGAGSASNSDLGAEFIAKDAFRLFKGFIESNSYHKNNLFPSDNEWSLTTNKTFRQLHQHLEEFAMSKDIEVNSVACTLIVVIYSPSGLLVAHLGDGRAGYCNDKGQWKSAMTPHKGEEANQTIFISTTAWQNGNDLNMSGVPVPESRVIRERPVAFTLMSDGCELHSFECSKMDTTTNKWHDPNVPFPQFFNPLVEHIKELAKSKVSVYEANSKWKTFVEEGTKGIKEESDDKTLILGILI